MAPVPRPMPQLHCRTHSAPPLPSLHPVVSTKRNSREPWHQWHPARRRPGSARPVHRTRRRSKKPMPSRYPGKMLARQAQCPASAIRGCSFPCCTRQQSANQAWRACPRIGPRFGELVALLRDAPPVMPTKLARTLLAVAESDAHDGARHVMQEDVETATALTGMPDAPLPLAAATLLCMAPDGYLTAATQSALLESYAGAMAAAARSLADDARTPDANEPLATTWRRRRRARRHPEL